MALRPGKSVFGAPASVSDKLAAGFQEGDNVILIGTLGEAQTINPFLTSESEGDWRCKMIFESFVRMDPATIQPVPGPGLASDWTVEDLTYTFTINANAKFSDGVDVTADDVAFTILGHLATSTASPRQTPLHRDAARRRILILWLATGRLDSVFACSAGATGPPTRPVGPVRVCTPCSDVPAARCVGRRDVPRGFPGAPAATPMAGTGVSSECRSRHQFRGTPCRRQRTAGDVAGARVLAPILRSRSRSRGHWGTTPKHASIWCETDFPAPYRGIQPAETIP